VNISEPLATTIKKTVCPFCSYACEFGVVFYDFGIKGIEYIKEGSSEGRLCPRGSAAALYLDHPGRLSMPVKNGKPVDWAKIEKELKKVIEKPKSVAVTFDRNITIEEYESIIDFCKKAGIDHIASSYCEPEAFLNPFMEKSFSIDNIDSAQTIVVLGDPFNQAPMLSKALINWKLKDRKNRLVVIDTIGTHTAAFASDFLRCRVGTEPFVLLGLAEEHVENVNIYEMCGISESIIRDVGKSLKAVKNGLIFATLSFGHTYDSLLLIEGLKKLQQFSGKRVVPFVEFAGFEGNQHFGSVLQSAKKRTIKYLINFGELFPYYYPQLLKGLKALNIYATSPIKRNGYTTLPVALNLEKQGSIITTFGKKTLSGAIKPASGAKIISEILTLMKKISGKGQSLQAPDVKIDTRERIGRLAEKISTQRKKKTFTLLGEKIAYNFLGFFEKEAVKMNPLDAAKLGIKPQDTVSMKSKHGLVNLGAKLTTDVGEGVVTVPAETPDTKGLFDFEIDEDVINFIPTEVELWRKE